VGNEHLVDVHIGHLRRKLGDDATNPRFIMTVRGVGYRMGSSR
jgi:DNA-binding response OmpR family regulator